MQHIYRWENALLAKKPLGTGEEFRELISRPKFFHVGHFSALDSKRPRHIFQQHFFVSHRQDTRPDPDHPSAAVALNGL